MSTPPDDAARPERVIDQGCLAEAARACRAALAEGAATLRLRPDLPGRIGCDGDHPLARSRAGGDGVPLRDLADLRELLADIPLDRVALRIDADAAAPWLVALCVALAEERGTAPERLEGACGNDPVGASRAPDAPPWPERAVARAGADLLVWGGQRLPRWRPVVIATDRPAPAGASAAARQAWPLFAGLRLLREAARRSKPAQWPALAAAIRFSPRPGPAGQQLARLWSEICTERHGAKTDPDIFYRIRSTVAEEFSAPSFDGAPPRDEDVLRELALLEAGNDGLVTFSGWGEFRPDAGRRSPGAGPSGALVRNGGISSRRPDRDGNVAQKALLALREAAKREINVMGPTIACAKAGVTCGEWAAALRTAANEFAPPAPPAPPRRPRLLVCGFGLAAPVPIALPPEFEKQSKVLGTRLGPEDIAFAVLRDRPRALLLCVSDAADVTLLRALHQRICEEGLSGMPLLIVGKFSERDSKTLLDLGVNGVFSPESLSSTDFRSTLGRYLRENPSPAD